MSTVVHLASKAEVPHRFGPFTVTHATADDTPIGYTPPAGTIVLGFIATVREAFDSGMFMQVGASGVGGNVQVLPVPLVTTGTTWVNQGVSGVGCPFVASTVEAPVWSTDGSPNTTGDADVYIIAIEPPV